jgi:hypothetical protein
MVLHRIAKSFKRVEDNATKKEQQVEDSVTAQVHHQVKTFLVQFKGELEGHQLTCKIM